MGIRATDLPNAIIRIGQQPPHCIQEIFNQDRLGEHDVGAGHSRSIDCGRTCIGGDDQNRHIGGRWVTAQNVGERAPIYEWQRYLDF